jgi:hypothetical protein
MQTVANSTPARKPSQIFRATLRDEAGTLAKVDGEILFFHAVTGAIVTIEPEDCVWLCVLGEIGLADTQQIMDRLHGGYAAVCTSRQMEVR